MGAPTWEQPVYKSHASAQPGTCKSLKVTSVAAVPLWHLLSLLWYVLRHVPCLLAIAISGNGFSVTKGLEVLLLRKKPEETSWVASGTCLRAHTVQVVFLTCTVHNHPMALLRQLPERMVAALQVAVSPFVTLTFLFNTSILQYFNVWWCDKT